MPTLEIDHDCTVGHELFHTDIARSMDDTSSPVKTAVFSTCFLQNGTVAYHDHDKGDPDALDGDRESGLGSASSSQLDPQNPASGDIPLSTTDVNDNEDAFPSGTDIVYPKLENEEATFQGPIIPDAVLDGPLLVDDMLDSSIEPHVHTNEQPLITTTTHALPDSQTLESPPAPDPITYPTPTLWKIKMVQRISPSTRSQREKWIQAADYNLFRLTGDQVLIDLLTDSGTGAMSDHQWAAIMTGDETYAGSSSYYNLERTVRALFGYEYVLPVHQGRAAENVLFSVLVKDGCLVPGNSHFDTTKAHIEFRKAHAVDCTIDKAADTDSEYPFKGNVDLDKLRKVLVENPGKIPFVIMTVTCNTMGGQPVSMENLKAVKSLADTFGVPMILDSARFSENAYFIQHREAGYAKSSIKEIVLEMHQLADAMLMSSKKDALVNIGGLLATNRKDWFQEAANLSILFEGFTTYGGMAGRDMNALAVGLEEAVDWGYLDSRISQVQHFGKQLISAGIPVQRPIGGHAVYVDCGRFFPNVPREEFPAQTLGVELFVEAGVRGVEIGTLLNGRDPVTGEERYAKTEFLRLAIPRRLYTNDHLGFVAAVLKGMYERREAISRGFKIKTEAPVLRHFTVGLQRL